MQIAYSNNTAMGKKTNKKIVIGGAPSRKSLLTEPSFYVRCAYYYSPSWLNSSVQLVPLFFYFESC